MEKGGAFVVLVIDYSFDWSKIFRGTNARVEQCQWKHLDMRFEDGKLICDIEGDPNAFTRAAQSNRTVVSPSAVLVRNFPLGLRGEHFRNLCLCLMISRVVCVNGAECLLATTDRAVLYAKLLQVQSQLGKDVFPVVALNYYSNSQGTGRGMEPKKIEGKTVIKVGSTNAGFGKSMIQNKDQRDDLWSILALTKEYVTEEPFIEHEFEYRVQVIGEKIRCFKRTSDSSWKNNTGNLQFCDMPVEERHKIWARACRQMWDNSNFIFALDVLRRADGSEVIIEINPTACGLMYEHEEEDSVAIRDLVLEQTKGK